MINLQYEIGEDRRFLEVLNSNTPEEFIQRLARSGCQRCSLCDKTSKIIVCRGNPKAKIMLLGEGPGKVEEQENKAFVGPAGQLLDKIFASVNINTETDVYLSNSVRCRPTSTTPGKQNDTPVMSQVEACKPYLLREIELVDPKIIIACGKTAALDIFGFAPKTLMKHIAGKFFEPKDEPFKGRTCFVIYHPAAILHAQGSEQAEQIKRDMWEHVKLLKSKIDELGIITKGCAI